MPALPDPPDLRATGGDEALATPLPPPAHGDDDRTQIAPVDLLITSDAFPPTQLIAAADRSRPPVQAVSTTLPGSPAPADSSEHRQAGRYQILERLGRGGMATVFRAHDPGIGRDVAIKFLHATLCEDEQYRSRFLREAKAAGALSHPNIVTVFDVGEIEGRPYLAMELLKGSSLAEAMEDGVSLSLRDAVVIAMQLALALDYAHAHGIVHRDIKPGNIAWLPGPEPTIKVMDFGIARMDDTGGSDQQRTRVGDVLGTPQYMSPEQTQGKVLDGRSDLFSAGILLYQMLTGQRPFQGDSLVALAVKIVQAEPPPLEQLRPEIPAELRRIVRRCLAKAPEKRFQSGREMAEALAKVLARLDASANDARDRQRVIPLRLRWAAVMALIVVVVSALSATLITQRQQAAMLKQLTDNGASLARFIAVQNAAAALGEDWAVVDVTIQEMMKTGDFQRIVVIDRAGLVGASSDPALMGRRYVPPASVSLGRRAGGVELGRYEERGEALLGFEAPITFQGKPVGRVALALPELPLQQVLRLSVSLMAGMVVVTVLTVAVAMYFVGGWFARPVKRVTEALDELARGQTDVRLADAERAPRQDEFGLLYAAFDRLAQKLHAEPVPAPQAAPGPDTPAP